MRGNVGTDSKGANFYLGALTFAAIGGWLAGTIDLWLYRTAETAVFRLTAGLPQLPMSNNQGWLLLSAAEDFSRRWVVLILSVCTTLAISRFKAAPRGCVFLGIFGLSVCVLVYPDGYLLPLNKDLLVGQTSMLLRLFLSSATYTILTFAGALLGARFGSALQGI